MRLCAFADESSSGLSGQIDALHRNGISLIEIRGVDGENISVLTPGKVRETARILRSEGIGVWSVGSPVGKIRLDGDFNGHLEMFRRLCETAELLGTSRIRLFSFFAPEGRTVGGYMKEAVLERLAAFCDAAPSGLVLCHENEKNIYGDIPGRCIEILSALPRLRAVFDPANFVQCGADTLEAWELLSPYVDYLHIKDAIADGTVVPAGSGIGNVGEIISRYLKRGGDVISVEPHLAKFSGLSSLEHGEKTKIQYDMELCEAFDLGVRSTKQLIGRKI